MGNIFAASEVVELGIQIEKNGRDFYQRLTQQTDNTKARDIFQFLGKEEEKHILAFEGILSRLQQYQPQEAYPGEYFAYMKSLSEEYVFTQKATGEKLARLTKTDKEAVEKGIGFEKSSITFYEGMIKLVPPYEQKVIDELIAQEQEHLRQLSELKNALRGV
ncbi:MAG: ferritin family protein [Candidatus Omnitrophota bacterium]